jgi:hypothetical protein
MQAKYLPPEYISKPEAITEFRHLDYNNPVAVTENTIATYVM